MEEGEDIVFLDVQVCISRRWESSPCWLYCRRLQSSLSIRVIYDPEIEESLIRFFFEMHFKRSFYLTQKFNKFI